jgi:hypothetical protein
MEVISVLVFTVYIIVCAILLCGYVSAGVKSWIFIIGFLLFFSYGLDGGDYETNHTPLIKEKVLVSVAPPQQEINGSISGNFLFLSGTIGQDTFYLLRERVSENTYLDFKVVNGAYIVEDDNLKDTGKFVQEYGCFDRHDTYHILGKEVIHIINNDCKFIKQSIVVPKGTVIKDMTGI